MFRRFLHLPLAPRARRIWLALPAVYVLASALRTTGLLSGAAAWHLTDLICLPLVLGGVLVVQRLLRRAPDYVLPRWHGACAWVLYGVYFEGVLPRLTAQATADAGDVLAYGLGWLIFETVLNRRS